MTTGLLSFRNACTTCNPPPEHWRSLSPPTPAERADLGYILRSAVYHAQRSCAASIERFAVAGSLCSEEHRFRATQCAARTRWGTRRDLDLGGSGRLDHCVVNPRISAQSRANHQNVKPWQPVVDGLEGLRCCAVFLLPQYTMLRWRHRLAGWLVAGHWGRWVCSGSIIEENTSCRREPGSQTLASGTGTSHTSFGWAVARKTAALAASAC